MPCLPQGRPGRGLLHSLAALALCCTLTPAANAAAPPTIQTIAGIGVGDGGPAVGGLVAWAGPVLAMPDGSVLVVDGQVARVRRVWPDGHISTFLGNGHRALRGDGGPASAASIRSATGLALDPSGSVYVSDGMALVVRKVDANGTVSTIAGSGASGSTGDGGPATAATLQYPTALSVGPDGSLYIADQNANRIRRVKDGVISTTAVVNSPEGVLAAPNGTVYAGLGWRHQVVAIDPAGTVTPFAGTGTGGNGGDGGPATAAQIYNAGALGRLSDGSILIADTAADRIRRVGPDGTITSFAGQSPAYGLPASADGGNADQMIISPTEISVSADDSVYVSSGFYRPGVRRISPAHITSTIASWGATAAPDGQPALQVHLASPESLAVAPDGAVAIGERAAGRVLTLGGDGLLHQSAAFSTWQRNDAEPATAIASSTAVHYGPDGALWVLDGSRGTLQREQGQTVTHVAGDPSTSASRAEGIAATSADLRGARDFVVEPGGTVVVLDTASHRVRRVAADGTITTIAGTGISGSSGDGGPATAATLDYLTGITRRVDGSLVIVDNGSDRLRRVAPDGTISTLAGTGGAGAAAVGPVAPGDGGPATAAALDQPMAAAVASDGTILFTEAGPNRVRAIAPDGTISSVAGVGEDGDDGDGGAATAAAFHNLAGIAVTASDEVLVADSSLNTVRCFALRGGPCSFRPPAPKVPVPTTPTPGTTTTPVITLALAFTPKAVKAKLGHVALLRLRGTAGTKITVTLRKGKRIVRTLTGTLSAKGRLTLRLPAKRKGRTLAVGRYTLTASGTKGAATATATGTLTIKR